MRGDIRAAKLAAIRADRIAREGRPVLDEIMAQREAAASSALAGIDPRIAYAWLIRSGALLHDDEAWRR